MRINSIFPAIQGEGSRVGTPEVFVRLQGCSLPGGKNCKDCDTPEAISRTGGRQATPRDVVEEVNGYNLNHVTVTGGEPLIQRKELLTLIGMLHNNHSVTLETSGQFLDYEIFALCDFTSFDVKTPSSGIKLDWELLDELLTIEEPTQFKMVVKDWVDYEFVRKIYSRYQSLWEDRQNLVITPVWCVGKDLDAKFVQELCKKVTEDRLCLRLIIQQHKILYGSEMRDV